MVGMTYSRKSQRVRLGKFCDIYCTIFNTLLRYELSETFCRGAVLNVMAKRHALSADKVKSAFARREFTNL